MAAGEYFFGASMEAATRNRPVFRLEREWPLRVRCRQLLENVCAQLRHKLNDLSAVGFEQC
eukprot:3368831-Amphidinium_carterae.2